jgi:hypothetical protein
MSMCWISVKERGLDRQTCTLSILQHPMEGQKRNLSSQRTRVRLTVPCATHTSCPSGRKWRRKSDQKKKITHISIAQAWLIVPAYNLEGRKGTFLIRLSCFECDRNYACNKEMDRLINWHNNTNWFPITANGKLCLSVYPWMRRFMAAWRFSDCLPFQ